MEVQKTYNLQQAIHALTLLRVAAEIDIAWKKEQIDKIEALTQKILSDGLSHEDVDEVREHVYTIGALVEGTCVDPDKDRW